MQDLRYWAGAVARCNIRSLVLVVREVFMNPSVAVCAPVCMLVTLRPLGLTAHDPLRQCPPPAHVLPTLGVIMRDCR